ncbi:hypothetical protein FJZ22_02260 [Candidatus Pacearchaeota archaeon]|nr:hypothetical protein [Candidatus Pacearchaeota archaeon]
MLPQITKEYPALQVTYGLPALSDLNRDFELDKIDVETEFLARTIRKCMMDKIVNCLNFFDMLLNPQQAPRIYLSFLQTITLSDKQLLEQLYSAFGTLSIECLALELEYTEEKEAEMITRIARVWTEQSTAFSTLVQRIRNPVPFQKKEKSYFG